MAVSKRTRFEVLRRDNHTCRYCRATDAPLTIDHVTPIALGGTDDPSNLVTACRDCNAGKSSSSPDAPLVADVAADELRWTAALQKAAEIRAAEGDPYQEHVETFQAAWNANAPYYNDQPSNWRESIITFGKSGLSPAFIESAVLSATSRNSVAAGSTFRYFCGICWTEVRTLRQMALDLLAAEEAAADGE
jgi:hypothetical protein